MIGPSGFAAAQPNATGSVYTGSAQLNETDLSNGTNTYGLVSGTFNNNSIETATASYFNTNDTTPSAGEPSYMLHTSCSMSTSTSETGTYTSSAPGGPMIAPTADNPGGYAKLNETRQDQVSVSNTMSVNWNGTTTTPNGAESAVMSYTGTANSSLTSTKTMAIDVAAGVDTPGGSYTMTGSKGEQSVIHRVGSRGGAGYGVSWVYDHSWDNGKSVVDAGTYPKGGEAATTTTTASAGSETDTWWVRSPGTTFTWTATSSTRYAPPPYTLSAPDGIGDPGADIGPTPPDEAKDGKAPWYNDSGWDWLNPAAWVASSYHGTKDALAGGYEFLTKDHASEWANYYAKRNANALGLSQSGDVAAFRQAEGAAIGQQARNVMDDAAKFGNAYFTGLQLVAGAPGMMRAAKGFVEGEFLNCTILQKACFAAGTPILTPRGPRPIETLLVTDLISCRAEDDPAGQVQIGMIDGIAVLTAQIWEVYIGGQCIETTAEHPFYLVGKTPGEYLGWTPVNRLREGDLLLGRGALPMAVERVVQTDRTATVYSLRVEPHHTFFIGGEDWRFSLWVHNSPCVNANRATSRRLNHGYAILDLNTGKVYKFGISSGKINAAGQSYRAVRQVNKLNAAGGRYVPVLLTTNLANRSKALQWEELTVGMFRKSLGHALRGNSRPSGISYLDSFL